MTKINAAAAKTEDAKGRAEKAPKVIYNGREVNPAVNHSRPRWGKTLRDRESGQARRNDENKDARSSWQQDTKASAANFPYAHCNGKRNRSMVTGKGKQPVMIIRK